MRGLVSTAITLVLAGAPLVARADAAAITWDFRKDRVDTPPAGFTFGRTGNGREGRWRVVQDPTAPGDGHVLAQLDADDTDHRFPIAFADAPEFRDVRVEVRCRPVSGKTDEACGLVFRLRDADDYYVARANALEDNVNLYRVVKGERRQLQGWSGKVSPGAWHVLAIEARGDRLRVFWEGNPIIDVRDSTFVEAGKVGVWTKADSVTHFAELTATPLR